MKLSEKELQELAAQLSNPEGKMGIEVGEMMNFTNENIILRTIDTLKIITGDRVLEIGPGNGSHVYNINKTASYYGADISQTMIDEAIKRNAGRESISFVLTNGETLPFENNFFDKAFTTNTIYFWKNPQDYANEIARTIKPEGLLSIGFIPKSTMEKIPFAKYGFTMYETTEVMELLERAGFEISNIYEGTEWVLSNNGDKIEREIAIVTGVLK